MATSYRTLFLCHYSVFLLFVFFFIVMPPPFFFFFFFNDPPPPEFSPFPLHASLPICLFAFALIVRLPTALRPPSRAPVTFSEATAPVKLPASHGPRRGKRPREIVNKTRVVFHCWLPLSRNPGIDASHLCYAGHADDQ